MGSHGRLGVDPTDGPHAPHIPEENVWDTQIRGYKCVDHVGGCDVHMKM